MQLTREKILKQKKLFLSWAVLMMSLGLSGQGWAVEKTLSHSADQKEEEKQAATKARQEAVMQKFAKQRKKLYQEDQLNQCMRKSEEGNKLEQSHTQSCTVKKQITNTFLSAMQDIQKTLPEKQNLKKYIESFNENFDLWFRKTSIYREYMTFPHFKYWWNLDTIQKLNSFLSGGPEYLCVE